MVSPPPAASTPLIRARMASQRRKDTAPEMALRRALHARGLRYRVDVPVVGTRRRGDLVFKSAKVVVFVDGCFWHGCPQHGTIPKRNASWWAEKIAANVRRDRDTDRILTQRGWAVVRVWEHESTEDAVRRVFRVVRSRLG